MKPHELLALENLQPKFKYREYNGFWNSFLRNENKQYRGEAFLIQLSKQLPFIFKLLADEEEFDIPTYIYIEAGIHAGGDLLKFFMVAVPNVKEQLDLEVVFPQMMQKHWNIMAYWPKFSSRADWVEALALRWYTSFEFADTSLRSDADFVTKLILKQPLCFKHASLPIRNNLPIALMAVSLNERNFLSVGEKASRNFELCHLAISKNPKLIQHISLTHPDHARLLAFALEKDPSIVDLVPKHLTDPKKKLDQIQQHASLHLAYGITPPRLRIKENASLNISEKGRVQIFLIYRKEMQTFTLPYQKVRSAASTLHFINLDLRQQSSDQERFLAWQEELSEAGAMQIQLQNVGIALLPA